MLPKRDGSFVEEGKDNNNNLDSVSFHGDPREALVKQYSKLHNNDVLFDDEQQQVLESASSHTKKTTTESPIPTPKYEKRSSWDEIDILERLQLEDLDDDFEETLDIKPDEGNSGGAGGDKVIQPPKKKKEKEGLPVTSFHSDRAGNIVLGKIDGKVLAWNGRELLEADVKDAEMKTIRSSKTSRRSTMSHNTSSEHKSSSSKKKKDKTASAEMRKDVSNRFGLMTPFKGKKRSVTTSTNSNQRDSLSATIGALEL